VLSSHSPSPALLTATAAAPERVPVRVPRPKAVPSGLTAAHTAAARSPSEREGSTAARAGSAHSTALSRRAPAGGAFRTAQRSPRATRSQRAAPAGGPPPQPEPEPATLAQPAPNRHLPRPDLVAAPGVPHKAQRTPPQEEPSPAQPSPTRPAAPPPAARPRHLQHHSGPDGCREATPPEAAPGPAGAARSVLRYEDVRPPDTHRSAARRRRVPAYPSAQPRLGRPPPGALIPYAAGRLPIGRLAVARGAGPRRNGGGGERGGEGLLQVRRGAALGGARQLEGRGCALRLRGGPAAVRIGEVAGAAGSRC